MYKTVKEFLSDVPLGETITLRSRRNWLVSPLRGDFSFIVCEVHLYSNQICLADSHGLYIYNLEMVDGDIVASLDCEDSYISYTIII